MSKIRVEYIAKGTTVIDMKDYDGMTVSEITDKIKEEAFSRLEEDHTSGLLDIEVNILRTFQDEELEYKPEPRDHSAYEHTLR